MKGMLLALFVALFCIFSTASVAVGSCKSVADKCHLACDTKFADDGYNRRGCKQKCVTAKINCQSKAGSKKLKKLTDKGAKKVEDFFSGLKD